MISNKKWVNVVIRTTLVVVRGWPLVYAIGLPLVSSGQERPGLRTVHVYAHRWPFLHTAVPGHDIAQEDTIAYTIRENFGLRTQPLLLVRLGSHSYRITQKCGLPVDHSHVKAARRSLVISVTMVEEVCLVNNL